VTRQRPSARFTYSSSHLAAEWRARQMKSFEAALMPGGLNPELQLTRPNSPWRRAHAFACASASS